MQFGQLGSFAFSMLEFGVTGADTRSFLNNCVHFYDLAQEQHHMLLKQITYVQQ